MHAQTTGIRLILLAAVLTFMPLASYAASRHKKSSSSKGAPTKRKRLPKKKEVLPSPPQGWKDACELAPDLVQAVRAALLANKDPKRATWQFQGTKYQHRSDPAKSYGQTMARFYFDRFIQHPSLVQVGAAVVDMGKVAADYHEKVTPLLAKAETVELGLKALWQGLAKGTKMEAKIGSLQGTTFAGTGKDELSHALTQLAKAVTDKDTAACMAWSAEAYGATARLADLLRWVDVQTEWFVDLAAVLASFEPCFAVTDAGMRKQGGQWKNFMFGRLPAANSIQALCYGDAPMVDHLLCDFYVITADEKFGALPAGATHMGVLPKYRATFATILEALPKKTQKVFANVPLTHYELSMLNADIWRYAEEKQVDNLISALQRYAKNYGKPDCTTLMEVFHVSQGAWGASTSATDRFHSQVLAYAKQLPKKKPKKAAAMAHDLAYGFYTWDGKPHYQGRIWTLHDAFKAKAVDCIRISQLIGCIYANAGYAGLYPVRIGRGNWQAKAVAMSGHTFLDWVDGKNNTCMDGLKKACWLKPYETMHAGDNQVVSFAQGYRSLNMWVAGAIFFPQGPRHYVHLRIPYYGLARDGF